VKVKLLINDNEYHLDVSPNEYLLDTLRKLNYVSVKRGCDTSSCGVCTILLNNQPVQSCSLLTVKADLQQITTVEGIYQEAEKFSHYMGHEGADQCGFCNPSLCLTVHALKLENPNPSLEQIKEYLIGNLCRCTGYQAQHIAIKSYLEDDYESRK
jgi:carbon-monoxide dehydrogenase small subunit